MLNLFWALPGVDAQLAPGIDFGIHFAPQALPKWSSKTRFVFDHFLNTFFFENSRFVVFFGCILELSFVFFFFVRDQKSSICQVTASASSGWRPSLLFSHSLVLSSFLSRVWWAHKWPACCVSPPTGAIRYRTVAEVCATNGNWQGQMVTLLFIFLYIHFFSETQNSE